ERNVQHDGVAGEACLDDLTLSLAEVVVTEMSPQGAQERVVRSGRRHRRDYPSQRHAASRPRAPSTYSSAPSAAVERTTAPPATARGSRDARSLGTAMQRGSAVSTSAAASDPPGGATTRSDRNDDPATPASSSWTGVGRSPR